MKKYFIASDIHSFFNEFKSALSLAGYNKKNKEHILILNGDLFDRGEQTIRLFKFLRNIPKSRLILVKGNHEELFDSLLEKDYPDDYDFSNGTVKTFCHIANIDNDSDIDIEYELRYAYTYSVGMYGGWDDGDKRVTSYGQELWNKIKKAVSESPLYAWMKKANWHDWYELNNKFIITHSFIPLTNLDGLPGYYTRNRRFEYRASWRKDATQEELSDAKWGCPWQLYNKGYFAEEEAKGKILVCGHWHVSDFYENLCNDYEGSPKTNIFKLKGIIGIDCGVFRSRSLLATYEQYDKLVHPQNILIVDENNNIFDKFNQPITDARIIETNTKDLFTVKVS